MKLCICYGWILGLLMHPPPPTCHYSALRSLARNCEPEGFQPPSTTPTNLPLLCITLTRSQSRAGGVSTPPQKTPPPPHPLPPSQSRAIDHPPSPHSRTSRRAFWPSTTLYQLTMPRPTPIPHSTLHHPIIIIIVE